MVHEVCRFSPASRSTLTCRYIVYTAHSDILLRGGKEWDTTKRINSTVERLAKNERRLYKVVIDHSRAAGAHVRFAQEMFGGAVGEIRHHG